VKIDASTITVSTLHKHVTQWSLWCWNVDQTQWLKHFLKRSAIVAKDSVDSDSGQLYLHKTSKCNWTVRI